MPQQSVLGRPLGDPDACSKERATGGERDDFILRLPLIRPVTSRQVYLLSFSFIIHKKLKTREANKNGIKIIELSKRFNNNPYEGEWKCLLYNIYFESKII